VMTSICSVSPTMMSTVLRTNIPLQFCSGWSRLRMISSMSGKAGRMDLRCDMLAGGGGGGDCWSCSSGDWLLSAVDGRAAVDRAGDCLLSSASFTRSYSRQMSKNSSRCFSWKLRRKRGRFWTCLRKDVSLEPQSMGLLLHTGPNLLNRFGESRSRRMAWSVLKGSELELLRPLVRRRLAEEIETTKEEAEKAEDSSAGLEACGGGVFKRLLSVCYCLSLRLTGRSVHHVLCGALPCSSCSSWMSDVESFLIQITHASTHRAACIFSLERS
jgi:hypothetical protein